MESVVVVARQPILDRRERLVGYEILFRPAPGGVIDGSVSTTSMSLQTMADLFMTIGQQAVVGDYLAYLNVSRDVLLSDVLEALPRDRIVIELLEAIEVDDEVVERCEDLKKKGYRLALDDFVVDDARAELLPLTKLVKVDLPAVPPDELPGLARRLRRSGVDLLAEKVEKRAEFDTCIELGFDLFQGYFFARPEEFSARTVHPVTAAIVDVLRSFTMELGPHDLAAAMKPHPELALDLIQLANSPDLTPAEEISSVEHAISFLGRVQVRRWLLILLFVAGDRRGVRNPLARLATVRGRAMELAVESLDDARLDPDGAFLIGMVSAAEVMLGTPIAELAERLGLNPALRRAVVNREGPMGNLLAALVALEEGRFDALAPALESVAIDAPMLGAFHGEADRWTSETLRGMGR